MIAIIDDFAAIRSAVDGAQKGDVRILSLFREWMAQVRRCNNLDPTITEEEYNEETLRPYEIEQSIADIPAEGPVGLSIKLYLIAYAENGGIRGDPCALGSGYMGDTTIAALRDVVRFMPELAPLCTAVFEEEDEAGEQPSSITDQPAPALPACGDDAELLAAERKIAELDEREIAIYREYGGRMTPELEEELIIDALDPLRWSAEALIEATAPRTLAGAAVKLRVAIEGEHSVSLRQVLALIEREARS